MSVKTPELGLTFSASLSHFHLIRIWTIVIILWQFKMALIALTEIKRMNCSVKLQLGPVSSSRVYRGLAVSLPSSENSQFEKFMMNRILSNNNTPPLLVIDTSLMGKKNGTIGLMEYRTFCVTENYTWTETQTETIFLPPPSTWGTSRTSNNGRWTELVYIVRRSICLQLIYPDCDRWSITISV